MTATKTIKDIEKQLFSGELDYGTLIELRKDKRIGVQRLLTRYDKQEEEKKRLHEKYVKMSTHEMILTEQGYQAIAGLDEVGRGPLAGPVIAAAVILGPNFYLPGLDDSKKLSSKTREAYFEYINEHALSIGIGIVHANEIDSLNIYMATKEAMVRALYQMELKPDYLLIDAMEINTSIPQKSLIKGDANSISIAASSIIAKVTRDRLMSRLGEDYPQFGFQNHMGYGTKEHMEAIKAFGITPIHRRSFSPIKDFG